MNIAGTKKVASVKKIMIAIFVGFHLTVLVCANIPTESVYGNMFRVPFNGYISAVGAWQGWNMFGSVAPTHKLDIEIIAEWADGESKSFNPIIPGFKPWQNTLREILFFTRLRDTEHGKSYYPGVANRYCQAIKKEQGNMPRAVTIRYHEHVLYRIHQIRESQKIAHLDTKDWGPYTCNG